MTEIQKELALLITARDLSGSVIRGVKGELRGLEGVAKKAGTNMARNLERGAIVAGTTAAAGIGLAVNAAIDWEDQFAGVKKTVDEADLTGGFPALEGELRELVRTLPLAHAELAAVAEQAGALGIAGEDIAEFTRITSLLGITTNVGAEEAATALGQLGNVIRLRAEDYERFASTLVDLGNKGASTEAQILEIARRSGGLAAQAGFNEAAILGWSSAVANLGMNEELAGSSMQRFVQRALELTAKGGKGLETFARISGKTADEFREAFKEDASGALETFVRGLGKLDADEQILALDAMGLSGVGLTRMLTGLAGEQDNLNDSLDVGAEAWEKNTALQKEADERFKTTRSQIQILQNNLRDAGITIGNEVLPLFNELVGDATRWLQENPDTIREFGQDLAGGLRDAVTWARSLDWEAIGDTAGILGDAGRRLAEGFLSMPPWVQAFLIGGFAANRFTGGALGDLIGMVGKGVIKGVMNMNAGVVNVNAASVRGGPGGGVPAGGSAAAAGAGGLLRFLGVGAAVAGGAWLGAEIAGPTHRATVEGGRQYMETEVQRVIETGDPAKIGAGLRAIESQIQELRSKPPQWQQIMEPTIAEIETQRDALEAGLQRIWESGERSEAAVRDAIPWQQRNVAEIQALNASEANRHGVALASEKYNASQQLAKQAEALAAVRTQGGTLQTIAAKRTVFNPNINVTANINNTVALSTGAVLQRVNSYRQSLNQGTSVEGFI